MRRRVDPERNHLALACGESIFSEAHAMEERQVLGCEVMFVV